jgi:hypothetical protein
MEQQKAWVGTLIVGNGISQDNRREVRFKAEELGRLTTYGEGRNGGLTDTRGVTETLYRTADGRLVVHVKDWSQWQGEPTTEWLTSVSEADLQPGGRFEDLGDACGFGRPLTLEEVLEA